jgi:iron complex transport system permease protein
MSRSWPTPSPRSRRNQAVLTRRRWQIPAAACLLLLVVVVAASIGPAGPPWWRVAGALFDRVTFGVFHLGLDRGDNAIVFQTRLPRVALAGLVGAMLSIAGASYQGVFRNPLVDPYLLGVAAGAGIGATVIFVTGRAATAGWVVDPLPAAAFVGALVAVALTYSIGTSFKSGQSPVTLVLAGVAVTSLASAIQAFVLMRNNPVIQQVYSWILGRLTTANWHDVRLVAPYITISCVVLLLYRRILDVLRVGDDEASALGTNIARVRIVVVVAATLGTAAAVSVSGLISFVGIIVPHAVRLLFGSSYRTVLPLSLLIGAAFLIVADIPGRILLSPAETPIGVVTAFFGAPFFILILRKRSVAQ